MNETFPLSTRYENLLGMAIDVAVREAEGGRPADLVIPAVTSTPRWLVAVGRSLLPLALVVLTSLAALVGSDASGWPGRSVLAGMVVVTLACVVTGRTGTAQLGLGLTATVAAAALLPWQVGWWPLPGVVGVSVYIVSHLVVSGRAAGHRTILRFGRRLTTAEAWVVVGLVVSSASVLLVFSRLAPPHLGTGARFLVALSPSSLVAVGVAFAVVNAFVEEVLFRGAVLHHLAHVLGSWPAVLVQALAFGTLHLNGYPYGLVGMVLASVYGLLLGALRLRSGGLLAPWIAHVCADAVIFVLIVQTAT